MSYILDALRRADAERGRAGVPGLHTQSVLPVSGGEGRRKEAQPLMWMGLGAAVVAAGAVAWSLAGPTEPPHAVALASATQAAAPPVGAAPSPHTEAAPAMPPDPAPAAPVAEPAPPPVAARPEPAAPPPERSTAAKSDPVAPRPVAVQPSPATPPAAVARNAAARARAAQDEVARPAPTPALRQERVYALHELPEPLRRAMPALDIGGSIYSATPASRFLIINGQIYHEGDSVTPELTLEEIHLRAAVLRFRDRRVQVTY